jgi:CIC family chloride channel protein
LKDHNLSGWRAERLCLLSVATAVPSFVLGRALLMAIHLCNNVLFRGTLSLSDHPLAGPLPLWCALVPALGGLLIGLVARYGSPAVRGHGIPEVIETVLAKESRVPWKVALLKPLCSALSIGSGGPFGAEGPVIGLGGSLGSLLGQILPVGDWERKVLLSAGAAAGITAVFGCPIAATFLALELLLYEFSPVSIAAVGLASAVSGCLRLAWVDSSPIFPITGVMAGNAWTPAFYAVLGLPLGLAAALITKSVEWSEQAFERIPFHWMWWPALGGLAVGGLGLLEPRILGPSYGSIAETLNGQLVAAALLSFVAFKALAWVLALGSGTAGGTLAPLFGIGAGLGALLTTAMAALWPGLGLDPRMGAMVGMAAVFAGASHAPLASMILALEVTHHFEASLPLLGACLLATLVCQALLPHSLMTEGPKRRGVRFPGPPGHPKGQAERVWTDH